MKLQIKIYVSANDINYYKLFFIFKDNNKPKKYFIKKEIS